MGKKDWNLAVSFDSSDADCITSTAGKAYISGVLAMADQMPNVSLFDFDGLTIKDVQKSACPTTTSTATTATSSTVTSTTETATTATSTTITGGTTATTLTATTVTASTATTVTDTTPFTCPSGGSSGCVTATVTITGVDGDTMSDSMSLMLGTLIEMAIEGAFLVQVEDFSMVATEATEVQSPTPAPNPNADAAETSRFCLSFLVSAALLVVTMW